MPVYRDQRMLRRNLLLKERLNMILMPNATTMVIMAGDMSAAMITEKTMSVVIIMGKASTAAIRRVTKAAAVITESKSP